MDTTELSRNVRKKTLKMVYQSSGSHLASAFSMVDILSVLYGSVLKIDSKNENWNLRDRFILSKGHACSSLYAVLAIKGFFDCENLDEYGKNGSFLMNHVSHKVPGVEFSTGSLGHGLPFAVGISLGMKIKNIDSRVYVLIGDGEIQEGSNWEALLFANHNNLRNLTIIIDNNKMQSLTTVEETMSISPLVDKLQSFGCFVSRVDGHDHKMMEKIFKEEVTNCGPRAVICDTIKGKGIKKMENKIEWHYRPPSKKEFDDFMKQLEDEKYIH